MISTLKKKVFFFLFLRNELCLATSSFRWNGRKMASYQEKCHHLFNSKTYEFPILWHRKRLKQCKTRQNSIEICWYFIRNWPRVCKVSVFRLKVSRFVRKFNWIRLTLQIWYSQKDCHFSCSNVILTPNLSPSEYEPVCLWEFTKRRFCEMSLRSSRVNVISLNKYIIFLFHRIS